MTKERSQPDFDEPPVVETVLGVEFAALEKWGIPHFGLFWDRIKDDYPRHRTLPPIISQIERFDPEAKQPELPKLEIVSEISVRCWFMNAAETRLIQIQNDRFVHNWRKAAGMEAYPHYENIKPTFQREWERYNEFLGSQGISKPEVRQCEVAYVNHIERGKGWSSFADLGSVISGWSGFPASSPLRDPEVVVINTRYLMPGNQGRVHIALQPAIRHTDAKEVLQLSLIARGCPRSSATEDLFRWFDLGREQLGQAFVDFTSSNMHKTWKRKA